MYLLDTNVFLRSLYEPKLLSETARTLLTSSSVGISFSVISIWEAGIKHAKHPMTFKVDPLDLLWAAEALGYFEIAVLSRHCVAAAKLPTHHRDPFDRMLVAQARDEHLTLLTTDAALAKYGPFVRLV